MAKSHNQNNQHNQQNEGGQQPFANKSEEKNQVASRQQQEVSAIDFIRVLDGKPMIAGMLGAVVGATLGSLLATAQGRSMLKSGFGYAKPMVSDYARGFLDQGNSGKNVH